MVLGVHEGADEDIRGDCSRLTTLCLAVGFFGPLQPRRNLLHFPGVNRIEMLRAIPTHSDGEAE